MGFIRDLGKGVGTVLGGVIGGPIQIVGELSGIEVLEDIGSGVRKASTFAGDTFGTFTEGTVNTISGIVQDDVAKRDEGLNGMGEAVGRTAMGAIHTAKTAVVNGGEIIGGALDGDMDSVKNGAKGLLTTVAVGALAIGVIDVVDGVDGTNVASADEVTDTSGESTGGNHVDPHSVKDITARMVLM